MRWVREGVTEEGGRDVEEGAEGKEEVAVVLGEEVEV